MSAVDEDKLAFYKTQVEEGARSGVTGGAHWALEWPCLAKALRFFLGYNWQEWWPCKGSEEVRALCWKLVDNGFRAPGITVECCHFAGHWSGVDEGGVVPLGSLDRYRDALDVRFVCCPMCGEWI